MNTAAPRHGWWLVAAIALFCGAAVFTAAVPSVARRAGLVVLFCSVLSALPTLNIISWVGESMQNARYLYTPCVWLTLFVAAALYRSGRIVPLAVWAVANLIGLEHNLNAYQTALERTRTISERVRRDYAQVSGSATILITDLPLHSNGVFFTGSELISQIQTKLPSATVVQENNQLQACPDLSYRWSPPDSDLVREPSSQFCPAVPH